MDGHLTLVIPYYENPQALAQLQYAGWLEWPEKQKERLKVILVDDGSENAPAATVARPDGLPELEIYRVLENRPWHQHGARNLGAHVAPDGWLLLTDMDHVLTAKSAGKIFKALDNKSLDERRIYMMDRVEADTGLPTRKNGIPKPHPNSFVVTRNLYWRIGGYDEDYCGVYGTDGLFKERAFTLAQRGHLNIPLTRYWRDIIPDCSTNAPRKEGREPGIKERIAREKAERGESNVVKVLQFPWERVV